MKHLNRLLKGAVEASSLETFQVKLDGVLNNLMMSLLTVWALD